MVNNRKLRDFERLGGFFIREKYKGTTAEGELHSGILIHRQYRIPAEVYIKDREPIIFKDNEGIELLYQKEIQRVLRKTMFTLAIACRKRQE